MKRIKKKVKKKAKEFYYNFIFKTVYIAGLTLLIPMIFAQKRGTYFIAAIFLILTAFVGLLGRNKNYSRTFKAMGKMTLIPGTLAFCIYLFGESIIYLIFGRWGEVVEYYFINSLPGMGLLLVAYVVVGGLLYLVGDKLKK